MISQILVCTHEDAPRDACHRFATERLRSAGKFVPVNMEEAAEHKIRSHDTEQRVTGHGHTSRLDEEAHANDIVDWQTVQRLQ
jgi:hypothetical protein